MSVAAVPAGAAGAQTVGAARPVSASEAFDIGFEAYQYAYPLVLFGQTQLINTNVATASATRAPVNQFAYGNIAGPDETDVVLPNVNVLYNNAFLNLQAEPIVLRIPNTQSRFFIQEILDAWTNVQYDPGTRISSLPGDYLLAGPNWKGKAPAGISTVYRMRTNLAWIAGRNFTTGEPNDVAVAKAVQAGFSLTPLSSYGQPYRPPFNTVNPAIDMTQTPVEQVAKMTAAEFFSALATWWVANPPQQVDGPVLAQMKRVGLVPGQPYLLADQPQAVRDGMALAKQAGYEYITSQLALLKIHRPVNGWTLSKGFDGEWKRNYFGRAVAAYRGIGTNAEQDAVYGYANLDSTRAPLDASKSYTITFPAGSLPPVDLPYGVKGFWSVTVYNSEGYLGGEVPNVLGSTQITEGTWKPDAKGQYSVVIQQEQPGDGSNWIKPPASGNFILLMRLYSPAKSVYAANAKDPYVPPAITPTGSPVPPPFDGDPFIPLANGLVTVPR